MTSDERERPGFEGVTGALLVLLELGARGRKFLAGGPGLLLGEDTTSLKDLDGGDGEAGDFAKWAMKAPGSLMGGNSEGEQLVAGDWLLHAALVTFWLLPSAAEWKT